MNVTQTSLTMLGLNTPTPKVFWNGQEIQNIVSIRVDCGDYEQYVKLRVGAIDSELQAELLNAGVLVKTGAHHE